jgi:hypothetical protein
MRLRDWKVVRSGRVASGIHCGADRGTVGSNVIRSAYVCTVELGYNVMKGTEYFVSL